MLEFVNLLFIPFISLHIWYRRHDLKIEKNISTLSDYVIWVVADLVICAVIMIVLGKFVGIEAHPDSMTFSIAECFLAIILPYIHEVFRKYFEVKVEITKRNSDKTGKKAGC